MIQRIVQMTFDPKHISDFLILFEEVQPLIQQMNGCHSVVLCEDVSHPNRLFTVSFWDNEDCLNAYRDSPLFEKTWAQTKAMFCDKPKAWSLQQISK
jgi:quinol monooxygenase YgiN